MARTWEHPALAAYREWEVRSREKVDVNAFVDGYTVALQSVRPLLEAARAYRDAWREFDRETIPMTTARMRIAAAENLLHAAARTFEADHVEEEASEWLTISGITGAEGLFGQPVSLGRSRGGRSSSTGTAATNAVASLSRLTSYGRSMLLWKHNYDLPPAVDSRTGSN